MGKQHTRTLHFSSVRAYTVCDRVSISRPTQHSVRQLLTRPPQLLNYCRTSA